MNPSHPLKVVIESIEGTIVRLRIKDDLLHWPKKYLPENIKAGDHLWINISDQPQAPDQEKLAKSILNEILKDDDSRPS